MKIVFWCLIVVLPAWPVMAGVQVDHEPGVDFSQYRTYAWQPGTDAATPQVQQWIVRAVERELDARSLEKVVDRSADLYVVTYAFAVMDSQVTGSYTHMDRYDVGVITADVVATTQGTLLVDLVDGTSRRPIWRGMAEAVMGLPSLEKVHKKVDKVVRKMFKDFPPSPEPAPADP